MKDYSVCCLTFRFEDGRTYRSSFPNEPPFSTSPIGRWQQGCVRGQWEPMKLIGRKVLRQAGHHPAYRKIEL